jgi:hypothetical protein
MISIFHRTKIPRVDMKVQVYSKFSKNKIWKKVKSPNSMRNGGFNTSKCRCKLQTIGEETLKGLFSRFLIPTAHLLGWCSQLLLVGYSTCPAMPILLLKTSNIHNFWSVGPKIMKFVLTRCLWRDASSQKVSKNLKIVWDQVTLPKTGLVTPRTFSPLGVYASFSISNCKIL